MLILAEDPQFESTAGFPTQAILQFGSLILLFK
jgi:hypothetical protein